MKTVQAIIDLFGGISQLPDNPIKIEVEGFMPLSIEFIGTGPREWPLVAVIHFYEQDGDLMRDPEMQFEVDPEGIWHPVYYRQDSLMMVQGAVFRSSETGEVMIRSKLIREFQQFMKLWDQNLQDQGFLDKAREMTDKHNPSE